MTTASAKTTSGINDVDLGRESLQPAALPVECEYVERRRRRRLDLRTIHGTERESARVYRELAEKRISLAEAEVRSRILGRHKEILNDRKQDEQIAAIQTRLEQLQQQGASALVHAPDEAELLPIEDDEAAA